MTVLVLKLPPWLTTRSLLVGITLAWALVFFWWSWGVGGGAPYYLDGNETFYSFEHGQALMLYSWSETWAVTIQWSDVLSPLTPAAAYLHNPNGSRYLHAALLLGIDDLPSHVLILGTLGTALAIVTAYAACRDAPLVMLAMAVDFLGFLAWTGNTYRVWPFVLVFAAIWGVRRPWPAWAMAAFACVLFQYEYGFALFVSTGVLLLALWLSGRARLLVAFGAGAALSVVVFAVQVVGYLGGPAAAWAELSLTYTRRSGMATGGVFLACDLPAGLAHLCRAVDGLVTSVYVMTLTYGAVVAGLVVYAVLSASVQRGRTWPTRLLLVLLGGATVTAGLLHGYYVDAFGGSLLPFAGFFVWTSAAVVGADLARLIGHRWTGLLAMLPVVYASLATFHPPFPGEGLAVLARDFEGQSILSPNPQLVYGMTRGRTWPVPPGHPDQADQPIIDTYRGPDGHVYLACFPVVSGVPAVLSGSLGDWCGPFITPQVERGHPIIRSGPGYTIVQIE